MGIEMTDLEDAKGIAGVANKPQFSGECRRVKLNEICSKGKSSLRQKDVFNDGPYSVYGASGVVGTTGDYQNEIPYVAVVKDGAGVGRASACEARTSVLGTMQALIPNSNVERDYLLHLVRSLRLGEGFSGSTIPHIYFKDYGKLEVPLPPLETQKEIVSRLGLIEVQIEQAEAQTMRLDNLVKSRFIEMFGDALNSDKRWPERTLGSMLDIARGGSPRPIKSYLTSDPAGINWIKIGDAVNGSRYIENTAERIKPSGAKKSRLVHSGDFLLSNSMSFGRPYILKTEGCIHDGWLVLQGVDEYFNSLFLYQLLASDDMLHRFRGLVRGGVVNNLNKDLVSTVSVMVPPIGLQRDFATFVQQVDKLRFDVQQQIDKLELLKNSLMQEYFG